MVLQKLIQLMVVLGLKFGYLKVKFLQKEFQLKNLKLLSLNQKEDQQRKEVNNYVNA